VDDKERRDTLLPEEVVESVLSLLLEEVAEVAATKSSSPVLPEGAGERRMEGRRVVRAVPTLCVGRGRVGGC